MSFGNECEEKQIGQHILRIGEIKGLGVLIEILSLHSFGILDGDWC